MHLHSNLITFQVATNIQEILKPLQKHSGVEYFSYGINYSDCSTIHLLTHPGYLMDCYQHEQPLWGHSLTSGWHTWNSTFTDTQLEISKKSGIGNGIIYVSHRANHSEIVEFATDFENRKAFDFYLNNTSLLVRFIEYFKQQAKNLILGAEHQKIIPPKSMIDFESPQKSINKDNRCFKILSKSLDKLSEREISCFKLIVRGYTISAMAAELNIAIPTVAVYIARIKEKLNCKSRKELFTIARSEGLLDF